MEFISRYGRQSRIYDLKDAFERDSYIRWKLSDRPKSCVEAVWEAFNERESFDDTPQQESIKFETKGTYGVFSVAALDDVKTVDDVIYCQLMTTEKLISIGYVVTLSEIKDHENDILSYMIHCKPSRNLARIDGFKNPLYGNIHSEVRFYRDEFLYFKLISHKIHSEHFDFGGTFDDLMVVIFGQTV